MAKETILVVEDEPLVGLEIREDLERLGYVVPDVVSSGEAVMPAVAKHRPALVIMDIRIEGGVDGIEAAYQIKAEFDVPIVYLTAYSDARTLRRAAETGPDAFLLKPFDERELAANVEMALARAQTNATGKRSLRYAIPFVEALEGAALVADTDGVIVHANTEAAKLLMVYDAVRLHGEPLSRFVLEAEEATDPAMPKLRRVRAADGSLLQTAVRLEPLTRPDGSRLGTLATFDSMTREERRLMESSVKEINETLARLLPATDAAGPRFGVASLLIPCLSGSGDLVDALGLSPSVSAFYGLDVMGHGTFASLIAYSLHSLVRDLARGRVGSEFPSPASLIKILNERYSSDKEEKPFFTIAYGLLDAETGEYRVARAGHPALIHLGADGSAAFVSSSGTAVGVVGALEVKEETGRLLPRDRLILVSDGLLEAVGGTDPGAAAATFLAFVEAHGKEDLEGFKKSVRGLIGERCPTPGLRDDASMLVLERR
jgi:CheY-like chemotaxis protein/serine phosphatase RsbU (regulator of sigma subunit)